MKQTFQKLVLRNWLPKQPYNLEQKSHSCVKYSNRPGTACGQFPKKINPKKGLLDKGTALRKATKKSTSLNMIKECMDKIIKQSNKTKITLNTNLKQSPITPKLALNQKPCFKDSKWGRDLENLYIHRADKDLAHEMHLLYQGGSPLCAPENSQNFKALPLSVAKINFKHQKPLKTSK